MPPYGVGSTNPFLLTVVKQIGDCIMKGILMIAVMIGLLFVSFLTTIAWAAKDNCTTELNTCTTELNNAQTNLGTCTTGLGSCNTNLGSCNTNLGSCNTNLGSCNTNFTNAQTTAATCQTNLATCQANVAECSQEAPPTSWDQQLACDSTSNCPRFEVLAAFGGSAVLDKETGLVWEQSPSTTAEYWEAAQVHCNELTTGNRLGWRLPTVQELASLVDPSVAAPGPTLPSGHPFSNVQSSYYWSATPSASDTSSTWLADYYNGFVYTVVTTDLSWYVWCVRGGSGVDPQ